MFPRRNPNLDKGAFHAPSAVLPSSTNTSETQNGLRKFEYDVSAAQVFVPRTAQTTQTLKPPTPRLYLRSPHEKYPAHYQRFAFPQNIHSYSSDAVFTIREREKNAQQVSLTSVRLVAASQQSADNIFLSTRIPIVSASHRHESNTFTHALSRRLAFPI
ncbi:hypothetical protein NMY22_g6389 [Coprinellus aureogranulatus]|nr:hypothetical protein NMY22_g6389 [Coprinellus aureogranulatus]